MSLNLIEQLNKLDDFREKGGKRHSLSLVLLIVIMATMSGYLSYRAMGDFVTRHEQALIDVLKVTKNRLPSYSTIRRVMMGIDFQQFTSIFNQWAMSMVSTSQRKYLSVVKKSVFGSCCFSMSLNYHIFVLP